MVLKRWEEIIERVINAGHKKFLLKWKYFKIIWSKKFTMQIIWLISYWEEQFTKTATEINFSYCLWELSETLLSPIGTYFSKGLPTLNNPIFSEKNWSSYARSHWYIGYRLWRLLCVSMQALLDLLGYQAGLQWSVQH